MSPMDCYPFDGEKSFAKNGETKSKQTGRSGAYSTGPLTTRGLLQRRIEAVKMDTTVAVVTEEKLVVVFVKSAPIFNHQTEK